MKPCFNLSHKFGNRGLHDWFANVMPFLYKFGVYPNDLDAARVIVFVISVSTKDTFNKHSFY